MKDFFKKWKQGCWSWERVWKSGFLELKCGLKKWVLRAAHLPMLVPPPPPCSASFSKHFHHYFLFFIKISPFLSLFWPSRWGDCSRPGKQNLFSWLFQAADTLFWIEGHYARCENDSASKSCIIEYQVSNIGPYQDVKWYIPISSIRCKNDSV